VWGTTQGGGLFRVDPAGGRVGDVRTVADGLPSDTLFSCVVDAHGTLWLGSARGLVRYLPSTGTYLTLGRPHGLPGEYCQQGALRLDEQGRLWVGTTDGVAVVTPHDVPQVIPPCAVFLTGLRIMGQERELVDGLEIEDSDYDLVVAYGAVTFVASAQVMYRTQLVGLERDWSRPHPHRFVRYTNLRPGDYTFRVAARNWGGDWSAPCEWRFRVIRNRAAHELDRARQRAEAAEAARAAAEAAVRIRNDVLSAVAHDLRSPLTGIMGHADLLQRRLERAEPPTQDWLRTHVGALGAGARRMASMVEEIMDVVHLQMGQRLDLQVAPVDLGGLVEGMARTLEAGAGHRATLEVDSPHDLVVEGDRARLERVVQNLLSNAVKYSPQATPVRITVRPQEEGVAIRVQDSGVGIPAGELPHIFTPFYRASTARSIPGTGIGLAGAKTIVEQHGGRITLASREGQGTTVTVYLPRRVPEQT
jgi:signal transduction histidine kinase